MLRDGSLADASTEISVLLLFAIGMLLIASTTVRRT
jgi:hypothetical protein